MKVKETLIARGRVEPVSRSRHRAGRGDLHQVPADVVGRLRRRCGHPADFEWNNPEPEVALVVASTGKIVGATLGNDVNLRDVEGRSALLLGKAKDNNASASLGPFVRLFDGDFTLDDREIGGDCAEGDRRGRVRAGRSFLDEPDFAHAGIAGGRGDRPAPPISRRARALSRHHVCAGQGPRRRRQGLHPQDRRHRLDLDAQRWVR